jgi:hypothetical protein
MKKFLAVLLTAGCLQVTLFAATPGMVQASLSTTPGMAQAATAMPEIVMPPEPECEYIFQYYDAEAARAGKGGAICTKTRYSCSLSKRDLVTAGEEILHELVAKGRVAILPTALFENYKLIAEKHMAVSWFNPENIACKDKEATHLIYCRPTLPVFLYQEKDLPGIVVPPGMRDISGNFEELQILDDVVAPIQVALRQCATSAVQVPWVRRASEPAVGMQPIAVAAAAVATAAPAAPDQPRVALQQSALQQAAAQHRATKGGASRTPRVSFETEGIAPRARCGSVKTVGIDDL